MLAGETNWDQAAGVFLERLSDEIKDELSVRNDNQSLDQLVNLAIHLYNRLRERRRKRRGQLRPCFPFLPSRVSPETFQPPDSLAPDSGSPPVLSGADEPMQLGMSRLTQQERKQWLSQRLCIYLGREGNFFAPCLEVPGRHSGTDSNFLYENFVIQANQAGKAGPGTLPTLYGFSPRWETRAALVRTAACNQCLAD